MRKALLIGLSYYGTDHVLGNTTASIIAAANLYTNLGFTITQLLETPDHTSHFEPTTDQVLKTIKQIISAAHAGDFLILHFCGRCDTVDRQIFLKLLDDQLDCTNLHHEFVNYLPEGVKLRCCFDSVNALSPVGLHFLYGQSMTGGILQNQFYPILRDTSIRGDILSIGTLQPTDGNITAAWIATVNHAHQFRPHMTWKEFVEYMTFLLKKHTNIQPLLTLNDQSMISKCIDL